MITGKYEINLQSPLGPRKGILSLYEEAQSVTGSLTMFNNHVPIKEGSAQENAVRFCGEIVTQIGRISYMAEARVEEDSLTGVMYVHGVRMTLGGSRIFKTDAADAP
jgi:hypothetical protein